MRLKTVTKDGVTTTYTYNGDGDRVAQTVGANTTTYVLDVGTPLTMIIAETTGSSTIYYLHGLDLVAETDGTNVEYFAYDGLGSVRQILDSAGSPLLAQTFDPYGNSFSRTGTGQSAYGYSGEQTDSNGLVFLRARYYAPSMGRFMQMDPSRQERNPYQYSYNNPLKYTDPSGLCTDKNDPATYDGRCKSDILFMEREYDVTILFPGKDYGRRPNIIPDPCQTGEFPALDNSGNPRKLEHWEKDEVEALRDALGYLRDAMPNNYRAVTRQIAFVIVLNDGPYASGVARTCPEQSPAAGGCLGANWSNTNIRAVIVLHQAWRGKTNYGKQYTVLHELGHTVSTYYLQGLPTVGEMFTTFADDGLPDDKEWGGESPDVNAEHYFTGAFARYAFEHADPALSLADYQHAFEDTNPYSPPYQTKPLDQIIDSNTATFLNQNLEWYMENYVIPKIN